MSQALQILVTSSRGQTLRGALDHRSNLTFNLPRPVVVEITAQVNAGQDRGCVVHDGQAFAWFSADIFQLRQAADGTWNVDVLRDKDHIRARPVCVRHRRAGQDP